MKKKTAIFLMAACMALVVTACGGGSSADKEDKKTEDTKKEDTKKEEAKKEEKQTKVDAVNLEASDGSSLVYTKHELVQDYQGNNAVRVYFTYTNKSDKSKLTQYAFRPQIFQNGVECQMTVGDVTNPNEDEGNLVKEVMPEASLNVAFIFGIPDPAVPVTLRVSDLTELINEVYQEQELTLQ